jgi:hypothetical protein
MNGPGSGRMNERPRVAVRWHPDRAGGSTERFQRIKAAFEYVQDERLGVHPAHNIDESAEPRRAARPRARPRERGDEGDEDAPDYRQGPLAFITARVVLLCGMKLAFEDRDEAEVRARLQAIQLRAAVRDTGGMRPAGEAQPAGGARARFWLRGTVSSDDSNRISK